MRHSVRGSAPRTRESRRLALLLAAGPDHTLRCEEPSTLLSTLGFDHNQRAVALALRDVLSDPENVRLLLPHFTWPADHALVVAHYRAPRDLAHERP